MPGPNISDVPESARSGVEPPRLLIELPSRRRAFLSNLADFLLGRVVPPQHPGQGRDYSFWKSLPPPQRVSRAALLESFFFHVIFVELIYISSVVPWFTEPVKLREPLSHTHIEFYSVSDYLPPTEPESAPAAAGGGEPDPVYSRQTIRSLPPEPDNLRQTIITPPDIKLDHDIPLPNLVAPAPAPMQPLSATQSSRPALILPPDLIVPPPDVAALSAGRQSPALHADVVAPAPEPTVEDPRLQLPSLTRQAVPPPVEASSAGGAQRSLPPLVQALPPPASASGGTGTAATGLPGAPNLNGPPTNRTDIIALSVNPAEIHGPLDVPNGNRRGAFAAGPEGRVNASGAPGGSGPASSAPEAGSGTTAGAGGSATAGNNAGITVAPGGATPSGAVAALPSAPGSGSPGDTRPNLAAAMHATSHPPLIPPGHEASGASPIAQRIFSGKRSFRLEVNMPNINSSTGSWIIHFAERGSPAERAPIASPEVLRKVDPAYPPALMHDGVEGTVVLWAVIRADGSVGEVRVLSSVDATLDKNAVLAFQQWKFAPGLKNGQPVDLEAVVQIPFRGKVVLLGR